MLYTRKSSWGVFYNFIKFCFADILILVDYMDFISL